MVPTFRAPCPLTLLTRIARPGIATAAVILIAAAAPVPAASQVVTDTLSIGGRSSWEEGFISFLDLDRIVLGPRSTGMGGTGLAVVGGAEYFSLNPALILGDPDWVLTSEIAMRSGGGSVSRFPERLDVGPNVSFESSNYRVRPQLATSYRNLSLGMPLVFLGKRGGLALAYRRLSPNFQGTETRFEVVGPVTNNIPATLGVGTEPEGGYDAFTFGVARNMSSWLDLGANCNVHSGEFKNKVSIGASVFGQPITTGGEVFSQEVGGFNIDLGAKARLGRLSLGGSLFLGYDLSFEGGRVDIRPLPDAQDPNSPVFLVHQTVLDHTISVPTTYGVGGAFQFTDRLLLAADYWARPFSKAEITRRSLTPQMGFADPADSLSFGFALLAGEGNETFSAGLNDVNSLRFGAEYTLIEREGLRVPFRAGFRTEDLAINNIVVEPPYDDYLGLIQSYYNVSVLGMDPPEGTTLEQIEAQLLQAIEFEQIPFQGDAVSATTISAGLGFELRRFRIDVAAEFTSFDIDRFFFRGFDPQFSPTADTTEESRNLRTLTFSTTMNF